TRLILGTCVEVSTKPAEGVHVTFVPDSTTTVTDADGDFVLDWSGRAGCLLFERIETGACRRVPIWAAEAEANLDVGLVQSPRGATSRTIGLRAGAAPPDTIRGSAPVTEETNRFSFTIGATFDLFGNLL